MGSLLTAPESPARVEDFFERLQTSSDGSSGQAVPSLGASAPRTAVQPLLLVNLLRLRRAAGPNGWRTYREDLGGFAIGWLIVFIIVSATALMLRS